jgi:exodeoxyribonuclease VII large subunit
MERRLQRSAEQLERTQARLTVLHPGRRLQERAQRLDELDERLRHAWTARLEIQRQRLRTQSGRLLRADPAQRLHGERRHLDSLALLLRSRMQTLLGDRGARLARANALLDSLNPEAVLARGYAIVRDEHGAVLHDAAQARPGSAIEARLARGSLIAEVRETRKDG